MTNFQSSLSELIALQRASLPGQQRPMPTPPPSAAVAPHPVPSLGGYMGTIEPHHLHQSIHFPPPPMGMPFRPPPQPAYSPNYETLFMPSPQGMSEHMSHRQMSNSTYAPGISPQASRAMPAPPRPSLPVNSSRWSDERPRDREREPTPPRQPQSRGKSTNGQDTRPGSNDASDDEDPDEVPSATSGPWNSMLSLVEAARLKADNHDSKEDEPKLSKEPRPSHPFNYDVGGPPKKRRRSELEEAEKNGVVYQRGTHKHAFQNPIELGMLSRERGKQLFDQYVYVYLNVSRAHCDQQHY